MAILKIHYTAGLNMNHIQIDIFENDGVTKRDTSGILNFGYDVSWSMKDYHHSIKQHEDMVIYGWKDNPYYNIKMFIGYVLDGYAKKSYKDWCDPSNWTGYNVFNGHDFTSEEINEVIKLILDGYEEA